MSGSNQPPVPPPLPPDDAAKLVGAWTAGTLSDTERQALHHAALDNQALFDQLADEEGVRELFADPATRRELSELLASPQATAAAGPVPAAEPWWKWIFRPASMAAFSAGAVAVLAFVVLRPSTVPLKTPAPNPEISAAPVSVAEAVKSAPDSPATSAKTSGPSANQLPAPLRQLADLDRERRQEPLRASPVADAKDKAAGPAAPAAEVAVLAEPAPIMVQTAPPTASAPPSQAPPVISAVPPLPVRYRIEREQSPGNWVEFGGELSRGEKARVAVIAAARGVVNIRSGRASLATAVEPGQTVYYPGSGSLPADPGELEVAILFQPGIPSPGGAPPPAQQFADQSLAGRLSAVGSANDRKKSNRAAPASTPAPPPQSQMPDTAATSNLAPQSVTLTVRLRYR